MSVLVNANVNKIVSDDKSTDGFLAAGVEFSVDGSTYIAHATKEVIVSSGYALFLIVAHSLAVPNVSSYLQKYQIPADIGTLRNWP